MKIPEWVPFAETEVAAIEASVAKAETQTAGEIVVAVAHSSHPWNGLGFNVVLVALIPFYLGLMLIWLGQPSFGLPDYGAAVLSEELATEFGGLNLPFLIAGALLCGFASALLFWGRRSPYCLRILTPKRDLQLVTHMRAEVEFYEAGLDKTDGQTGILLYVSLAERIAVVLADKGIHQKVPNDTWTKVVGDLVKAAKSKDLSRGISQAVETCTEILAREFPPDVKNPNEVSNRVRFLEPLL